MAISNIWFNYGLVLRLLTIKDSTPVLPAVFYKNIILVDR